MKIECQIMRPAPAMRAAAKIMAIGSRRRGQRCGAGSTSDAPIWRARRCKRIRPPPIAPAESLCGITSGNTIASPANSVTPRRLGEISLSDLLCAACTNIASTLGAAKSSQSGCNPGFRALRARREHVASRPLPSARVAAASRCRAGIIVFGFLGTIREQPLKFEMVPRLLRQGHPY